MQYLASIRSGIICFSEINMWELRRKYSWTHVVVEVYLWRHLWETHWNNLQIHSMYKAYKFFTMWKRHSVMAKDEMKQKRLSSTKHSYALSEWSQLKGQEKNLSGKQCSEAHIKSHLQMCFQSASWFEKTSFQPHFLHLQASWLD